MNIAVLVLIVLVANIIQGITGFGGPVLMMPFAMLLIDIGTAKGVVTFIAFLTAFIMAVRNRRDVNWREVWKMVAIMLIGMIPGIWLFKTMSLNFLKYIYGSLVLALGLKSLFIKKKLRYRPAVGVGTLLVAGVIQGMFTSGGAFVAFYSTEVLREKREFRATLSAVWAILNVILVGTNIHAGYMGAETLKILAICLAPTLLAIYIGGKLLGKINQELFMKIIYGFLAVTGVILLVT